MTYLENISNWAYNYSTDFCINMCHLLGVDYYTFGSLFFGFFMNGIIVLLVIVNKVISRKHRVTEK